MNVTIRIILLFYFLINPREWCANRMLQNAFVDMENMLDLLEDKIEVGTTLILS